MRVPPPSFSRPLFHHLNVIEIDEAGARRRALLLRLRHPSASHYRPRWTPEALTAHPVFRKVAGLDVTAVV